MVTSSKQKCDTFPLEFIYHTFGRILKLIDSICAVSGEYNRINGLLQACWLGITVSRDFYYDKLSTQQRYISVNKCITYNDSYLSRNEALYDASATGNNVALEFMISKQTDPNTCSQVIESN